MPAASDIHISDANPVNSGVDRKVLVTGANGFLARAVAAQAPAGIRVLGLSRPSSCGSPPGYATIFRCIDALKDEYPDLDGVLHLAAHIPSGGEGPDPELIGSNIEMVARLVRAYPDARHVHASSVSVYGIPRALPITMGSTVHDASRYGLSKLAGECVVRQSARHGVIRFSSIIGDGMRPGSFIPHAIAGARRGTIELHGDGRRLQNYIDVRDAAAMCFRAFEHPDCFVTLGVGSRSYSNLEVAELLSSITGASITHAGEDRSPSYSYSIEGAVDLGPTRYALSDTLRGMTSL